MANVDKDNYNFTTWLLNNHSRSGNNSETLLSKMSTPPNTASTSGLTTTEKVIFMSSVVVIGLVGCCANGMVLCAFLSSKIISKAVNKLMLNQIALDLFASIFLVATYGAVITDLFYKYPSNAWGEFMCRILSSSLLPFWGLAGSIISLVTITLDRYFKIVFPIAHRKYFRNWMIHLAIGISWLSGFLQEMAGLWTSRVSNGHCYKFYYWPSVRDRTVYSVFGMVFQYFAPVVMFIYCYGHILVAIRRTGGKVSVVRNGTSVGAPAGGNKTTAPNKSEANILKTMITISVCFVVCCSPNQFLYLLITLKVPYN